MSQLARRLGRDARDVDVILPFEEVVDALGRVEERYIGLQTIELDSILGTVDRGARRLRPPVPPDDARACARAGSGSPTPRAAASRCRRSPSTASATCTSSATATTASRSPARSGATRSTRTWSRSSPRIGAERSLLIGDLPLKSHERLFHERVPLARARPRAHRAHRPVALRAARRGRRGVGVPRDAGPRRVHRPPRPPRACGSTRTTCRSSTCCATRAWSSRTRPRPTRTCASSASATASCAPTNGARRSSPGCASRVRSLSAARRSGPRRTRRPRGSRRAPARGTGASVVSDHHRDAAVAAVLGHVADGGRVDVHAVLAEARPRRGRSCPACRGSGTGRCVVLELDVEALAPGLDEVRAVLAAEGRAGDARRASSPADDRDADEVGEVARLRALASRRARCRAPRRSRAR